MGEEISGGDQFLAQQLAQALHLLQVLRGYPPCDLYHECHRVLPSTSEKSDQEQNRIHFRYGSSEIDLPCTAQYQQEMDLTITKLGINGLSTFNYIWRAFKIKIPCMSFFRHKPDCIETKKEAEKSTSVYANWLSYSLLSCSPAELNSALLNIANVCSNKLNQNST